MDLSIKFGDKVVYVGSTAFFHGEGPNVEGFRLATFKEAAGAVTPEQARQRLIGGGRHPIAVDEFLLSAEVWAT